MRRIAETVAAWTFSDPLLFAAWSSHETVPVPEIATIRIAGGQVHCNPEFITGLSVSELNDVLRFEATRVLLGHPYARRLPDPSLAYTASNLAVQECLRTRLPMPRAREVFSDDGFDHQYFEFYYRELQERLSRQKEEHSAENDEPANNDAGDDGSEPVVDDPLSDGDDDAADGDEEDGEPLDDSELESDSSGADMTTGTDRYADPNDVGAENTQAWGCDDLRQEEINGLIRDAEATAGWGSIDGAARQRLMAVVPPPMDYRRVLRLFRQNVLSVRRRLTRMKPSRRYGFDQMGSRYERTTKLLFAVDVSGSMTDQDVRKGLAVLGGFFQVGVEAIDVIFFDTQLRGRPLTLHRARHSFEISGRGGTDFNVPIDFLDRSRGYDGLVVFTDGQAPAPRSPSRGDMPICWLFKDESTFETMRGHLQPLGMTTYLSSAKRA